MRYFILVIFVLGMACSHSKKATKSKQPTDDQVEEITVVVDQKNYYEQMIGTWQVVTMLKPLQAGTENLQNVTLEFSDGFKVSGKAPCNSISGTVTIKGVAIKFNEMAATRMACDKLPLENIYLKQLTDAVSTYTLNGDELLLRDGITNIIFRLKRVK